MRTRSVGVCPKCGKRKVRRAVRCAECYAKEMLAVGNAPVAMPVATPIQADRRLGVCPDCGGRKMRSSVRCNACYMQRRLGNHGDPVASTPSKVQSTPLEAWQGPGPVASRPGPTWRRWLMNEYGEWETAEGG